MTAVAIQVRPAVLRRARDIAARNLPRPQNLRAALGWDLVARVRAREATIEDLQRLELPWDGLLDAAEAGIRDGIPAGKKRARCQGCGTDRLVGVGLVGHFTADAQPSAATLRCATCAGRTVHTLLDDNDPQALARRRWLAQHAWATEAIPHELDRLRSLGVRIIPTDNPYTSTRLLRQGGTLVVRYRLDWPDSPEIARGLALIRLVVEAGVPDFVTWRHWKGDLEISSM